MASIEHWLIRNATIDISRRDLSTLSAAGAGSNRLDCRIRDGVVAELAPDLPSDGAKVIDAAGGALLPGLADHHLHLFAMAAARRSVDVTGVALETALDRPGDRLLRIIGADREWTRAGLDALWPHRPVHVQHRSGALWTLNSAALGLLAGPVSAEERCTGQFWRASARLHALLPRGAPDELEGVGAVLAALGVTHVTDATPDADPASLRVPQRVLSLARGGAGPRKIVLPDHEPIDLDSLIGAVRSAHAENRGVALHAVTAPALATAVAALNDAGVHADDRVEHAGVCDDDLAARVADLGVVVVTQPTIFWRRGASFRAEAEPHERDILWRYGGLLRAGIRVAVSSDAPYGDADPGLTMHAAATRDDPAERVAPETVLASMLCSPEDPGGSPRAVYPGGPADLCLLGTTLDVALRRAARGEGLPVASTFIAGRLVSAR